MENASKALLIAGAVLLVIAIIGVGMYIFQSTTGVQDQATQGMDQLTIQNFNSKFEKYESTSTSSTNARQVIRDVNSHNATSDDKITLEGITTTSTIVNSKKYSITLDYNEGGLVSKITIAEVTAEGK